MKDMPLEISLKLLLAIPFICAVAAAIYTLVSRRASGGIVTALIKGGCNSPESAKTLRELGINNPGKLSVFALRDNSSLSRVVLSPDRRDRDSLRRIGGRMEKSLDVASARFYIPEGKTDKARSLFVGKKAGILPVIGALALLAALLVALYFIIPNILDLTDTNITL